MKPTEGPIVGPVSAEGSSGPYGSGSASVSTSPNGGSSAVPRWKGRILRRFKLVDLLGQGSMGKVFRAEDITLRRYVALKVLPTKTKHGQRDHKIDQFIREARSAASVEHPHAVTVYEIGEAAGVHYIAMELVEGGNLEKMIKASGPMEIDGACQIAAEAAEALAAAHAQGIIHRDVKPSNLLLARNGRCKLADFGLARYDDPEDLTQRGECVGTPCYIAPELPLGQKATAQSDIYSLGCTLWFLLTGRPPFEAKNKQDMMKMHVYASLPDLRERRPEVPERLVEAINRACAKNPTDRFESADQFARVLRTFTIRTGGSSSRLPTLNGASAGGSLPGWTPDAPMTASSTTLGPHLSHAASTMGSVPQMAPPLAGQPHPGGLRSKLNTPIIWAAFGTVAAVALIAVGVWIARGAGSGPAQAVAAPEPEMTVRPRVPDNDTAAGEAKTMTNVLLNGGLENEDDLDGIADWFVAPKYHGSVKFVTEDGNRFLRITPLNADDTPHVDQKIELDPTWTAVTVAARMRVSEFQPGPKQPSDARVAVDFWDANDKPIGGAPVLPSLKANAPWTERIVNITIPPGARSMHVKLAVRNATGVMDFDDVRVIPEIAPSK